MKLDAFRSALEQASDLQVALPTGEFVPAHFHLTEIGKVTRHFIDCGGTERSTEVVNLQLWVAEDTDHRLTPEKLMGIVDLGKQKLHLNNVEMEVEFQGATIQTFGLEWEGGHFVLTNQHTDCLAKDNCGVPESKPKVALAEVGAACCGPDSGCC